MNMSDDVSGATLQVSMKLAEHTIELGSKLVDRAIDDIAKLLKALLTTKNDNSVKSTDLTDIKTGEVSIKDLIQNTKKNGDTLSTSEHGLTEEDKKYIKKKSKEYGIPVAFTGTKGKDNIYANVRTSDLPIFQRICTDMMKDKLQERPQELGNFKVKEWEIPFINKELNKHDLSAQFGKTENENFCLYEKIDEKAILIARGEFVRKCNELKKELSFDRDEEGFYTIKDIRSGRELSFDTVPSCKDLSSKLQQDFGYDENKANIACAKFGEENLQGQEKQKFFSNNPQNDFSKIDSNVQIQGESILVKPYTCWRLTSKRDDVPRIVFRDNDGNFAVLNPEKMTKKNMSEILKNHLKIDDKNTINALVNKAEKVNDYYIKQNTENFSHNYEFSKSDFDMSNPEITKNMLRIDETGNTFTKVLPINNIFNDIRRTDKNNFTVTSIAYMTETNKDGKENKFPEVYELMLCFSDKKNALKQLTEIYKSQGVPEHIAKQMAKDVFKKAENQSAEKVLEIQEIKSDNTKSEMKMIVKFGNQSEEIDISDNDKAITEIEKKFEVSETTAIILLEKAQENINNEMENSVVEMESIDEKSNMPDTKDIQLNELDSPIEVKSIAEMKSIDDKNLMPNTDGIKLDELNVPKMNAPTIPLGRGGR